MEIIADVSKKYENSTDFKDEEEVLSKLIETISQHKRNIDSLTSFVDDAKKQSIKQLRTFQADLIDKINILSDQLSTQMDSKTQNVCLSLSRLKTTLTTDELKAQNMKNAMDKNKGNDVRLFIATHRSKQQSTVAFEEVRDVEEKLKSVPRFLFKANKATKSLFIDTSRIGEYNQYQEVRT